jgi:hypothetical protein
VQDWNAYANKKIRETTNTKVANLKKLYNFVVDNFFIWSHPVKETMFEFLKFKIWIFKMTLNGETTNMKVIDLKKLCNFIVDNFSIGIIYYFKIMFKINFLKKFYLSF